MTNTNTTKIVQGLHFRHVTMPTRNRIETAPIYQVFSVNKSSGVKLAEVADLEHARTMGVPADLLFGYLHYSPKGIFQAIEKGELVAI